MDGQREGLVPPAARAVPVPPPPLLPNAVTLGCARGHVGKTNEGITGSPAHLSYLIQAHGWRQLSPEGKNLNHSLGGNGKPEEEEAAARGSAVTAGQGLRASPHLSRGSPAPSNV